MASMGDTGSRLVSANNRHMVSHLSTVRWSVPGVFDSGGNAKQKETQLKNFPSRTGQFTILEEK